MLRKKSKTLWILWIKLLRSDGYEILGNLVHKMQRELTSLNDVKVNPAFGAELKHDLAPEFMYIYQVILTLYLL